RRGFIWPSFEIYGGVAGFYDFGPLGALLKNNIIQKWREFYVIREGFFEISSPSVTPEEVLEASGHVDHFVDAMVECKRCGAAFKVADLAEETTGKSVEGLSNEEMEKFIEKHKLRCPDCGGELGKVFDFNAMFKTSIGPGSKKGAYLRPETAQTIFIDFKRLQRHARGHLPFGVAQIGSGYRNEISPRQGVIRLREFTMAEAEIFFDPDNPKHPKFKEVADEKLRLWLANDQRKEKKQLTEVTAKEALKKKLVCNELMAYHLVCAKRFLLELGIPGEAIRFREQTPGERAHYSSETWDAEVLSEKFGWIEIAGLAYRTDYDLSRHAKFSKEDLTVFVQEEGGPGKKVLCHVVEPSYGIDRPLYCVLEHSLIKDGKRSYLKLKKELAPIEVGVFPLLNRDGLPEEAKEVFETLKQESFFGEYDNSGTIGRRYARADEVGVPYCVTIDHQTLEDGTVTIRERDSMKQIRVKVDELSQVLCDLLEDKVGFQQAGEPITRKS
ncbi:MAG: glycine--tRNA ligase, partial [Candidatus Hadarchaeota archaeon]|nr:glycine--tRNA ligase [Candidatus Hadarchaeota archaeon]